MSQVRWTLFLFVALPVRFGRVLPGGHQRGRRERQPRGQRLGRSVRAGPDPGHDLGRRAGSRPLPADLDSRRHPRQHGLSAATTFCPATPNSTGLPARVDFGGTSSVSINDGRLLVSNCPPSTTGLFLAGDVQTQVPFGNGVRCVAGRLLRLGTIHLGANGAGSNALDVHAPPAAGNLIAGTRWNFQCAYRDVAAGGARFNASDAIAVDFVP